MVALLPGRGSELGADADRRTAFSGDPADVARATSGVVPVPEACPDGSPGPLRRGGGAGDRRRRSMAVSMVPAAVTSRGSRMGTARGAAVTDMPPGCRGDSLGTPRAARRRPRSGNGPPRSASARSPVRRGPGPGPVVPIGASVSVSARHQRGARTDAPPVPEARTLAGTPTARRTARERPVAALKRTDRAARWPMNGGRGRPRAGSGRRKRSRIAAARGAVVAALRSAGASPALSPRWVGSGTASLTRSSPGTRCGRPRAARRAAPCCRRGTPVPSTGPRRPGRTPTRAAARPRS